MSRANLSTVSYSCRLWSFNIDPSHCIAALLAKTLAASCNLPDGAELNLRETSAVINSEPESSRRSTCCLTLSQFESTQSCTKASSSKACQRKTAGFHTCPLCVRCCGSRALSLSFYASCFSAKSLLTCLFSLCFCLAAAVFWSKYKSGGSCRIFTDHPFYCCPY